MCEGDDGYCGADEDVQTVTSERGTFTVRLDLCPECRTKQRKADDAYADWESAGDYARDEAKDGR